MEELRHLAQANVSMDIDTFTNLNPRVLQVSGAARQGESGSLRSRSAGPNTPKSEVCREWGPRSLKGGSQGLTTPASGQALTRPFPAPPLTAPRRA